LKNAERKIEIIKNGPYIVSGSIPLHEKIIVAKGHGCELKEGRPLPQAEEYALCRCGHSKNAPFCDGSHFKTGFNGAETASTADYLERAGYQVGPEIDLLDDDRCAFARFCHRENGSTWELTRNSDDAKNRAEAIRTASACPSGRLTAVEKSGELIEPILEASVDIIQDPMQGASSGIFVKGNIPLESADGTLYELRNRYALCRCGKSENKPFCDACHVSIAFSDK